MMPYAYPSEALLSESVWQVSYLCYVLLLPSYVSLQGEEIRKRHPIPAVPYTVDHIQTPLIVTLVKKFRFRTTNVRKTKLWKLFELLTTAMIL